MEIDFVIKRCSICRLLFLSHDDHEAILEGVLVVDGFSDGIRSSRFCYC